MHVLCKQSETGDTINFYCNNNILDIKHRNENFKKVRFMCYDILRLKKIDIYCSKNKYKHLTLNDNIVNK